jgi:predicted NBD/HSP70 family sugar kinase
MRFLGIDVGGTSIKLAAVSGGRVLWTGKSRVYARPTADQLAEALKQAAEGRDLSADGVGLCVPGLLDKARRMITLSVNVPGLMGLVLDDLITSALGNRLGAIRIVNDAVACATDVHATFKPAGRLLVMAIGTGIGAAVLDDGVPLIVEGESPGHIGQLDVTLPDDQVIGPDGGAGSLEGYLGVPALVKRYRRDVSEVLPSLTGEEPPFRALARAIRICHAIYRPHHVCLAGGIGIRLEHVLATLKGNIDRDLSSVARQGWSLFLGNSDFHASAGAARVAAAEHRED